MWNVTYSSYIDEERHEVILPAPENVVLSEPAEPRLIPAGSVVGVRSKCTLVQKDNSRTVLEAPVFCKVVGHDENLGVRVATAAGYSMWVEPNRILIPVGELSVLPTRPVVKNPEGLPPMGPRVHTIVHTAEPQKPAIPVLLPPVAPGEVFHPKLIPNRHRHIDGVLTYNDVLRESGVSPPTLRKYLLTNPELFVGVDTLYGVRYKPETVENVKRFKSVAMRKPKRGKKMVVEAEVKPVKGFWEEPTTQETPTSPPETITELSISDQQRAVTLYYRRVPVTLIASELHTSPEQIVAALHRYEVVV